MRAEAASERKAHQKPAVRRLADDGGAQRLRYRPVLIKRGANGAGARWNHPSWAAPQEARISEIRGDQFVGTSAGASVNLHGGNLDQVAVQIECSEKCGLVASNAGFNPLRRIFVHKECDFHWAIMPPKPHGPPCRVIGTASIGKIERHDPVCSVGANRAPARAGRAHQRTEPTRPPKVPAASRCFRLGSVTNATQEGSSILACPDFAAHCGTRATTNQLRMKGQYRTHQTIIALSPAA
jgi:hypothetical protein